MNDEAGPSLRHLLGLAVVLAAVWLLWSGHFSGLLLSLGAASCALVVFLSARMGIVDNEGQPLSWGTRPLVYLPWLVVEVIKANIDVALRIVGLRPVAPVLARVAVPHKTDLGRVLYADSITLTPGTVAIELDRDSVLVHAISPEGIAGLETGEMARRVLKLEGS
jgi:multicomponent Na+:H+ antiporter subunit E